MARRAGADAIGKYARFVAKTWSVVGYFGMVAGLLGLLATRQLFSSSPLVIGIQVLAAILFLWARMTFGLRSFHLAANPTEGGLVRSGPYRMIRHPIYSAMCLIAAAGAAGNWSWESGLCVATVVIFAVVRISCEEPMVAERYPEYNDYAKESWRLIPFVY